MALSAINNGFNLNVIGPARKDFYDTIGSMDKLWAYKEFGRYIYTDDMISALLNHIRAVSAIPSDAHHQVVVVLVDAYNTLFTGDPKTLVRKLISSGHRVVFAAQKSCCRFAAFHLDPFSLAQDISISAAADRSTRCFWRPIGF